MIRAEIGHVEKFGLRCDALQIDVAIGTERLRGDRYGIVGIVFLMAMGAALFVQLRNLEVGMGMPLNFAMASETRSIFHLRECGLVAGNAFLAKKFVRAGDLAAVPRRIEADIIASCLVDRRPHEAHDRQNQEKGQDYKRERPGNLPFADTGFGETGDAV